jgi:hypothetical protein
MQSQLLSTPVVVTPHHSRKGVKVIGPRTMTPHLLLWWFRGIRMHICTDVSTIKVIAQQKAEAEGEL